MAEAAHPMVIRDAGQMPAPIIIYIRSVLYYIRAELGNALIDREHIAFIILIDILSLSMPVTTRRMSNRQRQEVDHTYNGIEDRVSECITMCPVFCTAKIPSGVCMSTNS